MTGFKNVKSYNNDQISNLLEINLKEWLVDSFMRIGAIIPQRVSQLTPNESDGVINLSVWNAPIQGWAYKILDNNGNIVLTPAIITVNGTVEPNVTINYARGQVTFNRELLASDVVQARHFTNRLSIFTVLELNRRPMIQLGTDYADTSNNEDYTVFQELAVSETIRTPYIILETFPTGSAKPYMLGTGTVWTTSRVQMNVVTETVGELSKILDILRVQSFKTTRLFDTNRAAIDGVLPIDPITGDINTSPLAVQYPDILKDYYIDSMYWKTISVRKFKTTKEDIHMGIAYFTVEIISNPYI